MTQFNRPDTPLSRDTAARGYVPNASAEELDDPETNNLNKHPMEHTNWVDPAGRVDQAASDGQIADEPMAVMPIPCMPIAPIAARARPRAPIHRWM